MPGPLPFAAKRPGGVGLEVVHHPFGRGIGVHDDVHMVRANVGGQQDPPAMCADLLDGAQSGLPLASVKHARSMTHPPLRRCQPGVRGSIAAARDVVLPVD